MRKIIFISGVHGVGKTTLCTSIKDKILINNYSCSDLIKNNSSYVESSKFVDSADKNQLILIEALGRISDEKYLLDGHFCLIGKNGGIIKLDEKIFDLISPSAIINVFCSPKTIKTRLEARDSISYSLDLLSNLQLAEKQSAEETAEMLNIPLFSYESGTSIDDTLRFITNLIKYTA